VGRKNTNISSRVHTASKSTPHASSGILAKAHIPIAKKRIANGVSMRCKLEASKPANTRIKTRISKYHLFELLSDDTTFAKVKAAAREDKTQIKSTTSQFAPKTRKASASTSVQTTLELANTDSARLKNGYPLVAKLSAIR
jgi:hypothetical protein